VLVFGVSAFLARPVTRGIALQGLAPDTPERAAQMDRLLDEPPVRRALRTAALVIGGTNLLAGVANFAINWAMVTAPFNTPAFNDQVANVNAITRVVLVLPDLLALFWAFSLMYKAMYAQLPADGATDPDAGEFWRLLARREDALALVRAGEQAEAEAASVAAVGGLAAHAVESLAARQAREEFGLT
jgi:hypothetical protein